jgi:hypothetical protein
MSVDETILGRAIIAADWAGAITPFESYALGCDCIACTLFTELRRLLDEEKAHSDSEECFDWEDPRGHSLECTCESCIQNYPERGDSPIDFDVGDILNSESWKP